MGLQTWAGYLFFFGIPVVLWAVGTAAIRSSGFGARMVAFFAGSDNRLSLSRAQAFLWTLVIFGSFAAAMAIHSKIYPITTQESKERVERARAEADRAAKAVTEADTRVNATRKVAEEASAAKAKSELDAAEAKRKAQAEPGNVEKSKAADEAASKATEATARLSAAEADAARSQDEAEKARPAKAIADRAAAVSGNDWVKIPAELLALAGIALGSGVFSSLISTMKGEEKTACVTGVQVVGCSDFQANPNGPWAAVPAPPFCLIIGGRELGKSGQVRLNGHAAPVRDWRDDGTRVVAEIPDNIVANPTLIVDTGNGKLCYKLQGSVPQLTLGGSVTYYEFGDLFRDDKDPRNMDLMKFQMFGWTLVAIFIYAWLFLHDLHDHIETLPRVDSSIVLLTGLSQTGYLTGKAVSNVNK